MIESSINMMYLFSIIVIGTALLGKEERILSIAKRLQRCTEEWFCYQWHQANINVRQAIKYS